MKRKYSIFVLTPLMVITILIITGFQIYWLLQNFKTEEHFIELHTSFLFHESTMRLQFAHLKVYENNTLKKGDSVQISIRASHEKSPFIDSSSEDEMFNMYELLSDKFHDSAFHHGRIIVSVTQSKDLKKKDSLNPPVPPLAPPPPPNNPFLMLAKTDSLQDSLHVADIKNECSVAFKRENLDVPFTVLRTNSNLLPSDTRITVGFKKPVTYTLLLGDITPFILKKLALSITFSVFLLSLTIVSFILIYRYIVREKKLAMLKDDFINNVTHELKTPIATVSVAIEAMKNFNAMDDAGRTREYLDISSGELQRLSLLVDKVLKLSMFDSKEMVMTLERIDLKHLVDEAVNSLRLQIEKNNAALKIHSEGEFFVTGDRLHLQSVIFNLLDNALKYRSEKPNITIRLKKLTGKIFLTVIDNGIGIAPEYKGRIFEKFFRVPSGDVRNTNGYGLGLNYVQHVVDNLNGEIHVESKLAQGSSFTVILPEAK